MSEIADTTLAAFLEAGAMRTATPGGGAGCAVIGAIGAAFGAMAIRYTEGRPGTDDVAPALTNGVAALDLARAALLDLAERDVQAFGEFDRARTLPKSNPDEVAARSRALVNAARGAAEIPLTAMRIAADALDAIAPVAARLNPRLASDTGVCAIALKAALRGLMLNVEVNLAALPDDVATSLRKEAAAALERGEWSADATLADAKAAIRESAQS